MRGLGRVPFAPQPFWDITRAGTLIRGDGTSYRLIESDRSGRVLREIRRNAPVERIPPTERRDSAQALRARIDSLNVPLNQVRGMPDEVRAVRLPENFPAINGVFAAPDGSVLGAHDLRRV